MFASFMMYWYMSTCVILCDMEGLIMPFNSVKPESQHVLPVIFVSKELHCHTMSKLLIKTLHLYFSKLIYAWYWAVMLFTYEAPEWFMYRKEMYILIFNSHCLVLLNCKKSYSSRTLIWLWYQKHTHNCISPSEASCGMSIAYGEYLFVENGLITKTLDYHMYDLFTNMRERCVDTDALRIYTICIITLDKGFTTHCLLSQLIMTYQCDMYDNWFGNSWCYLNFFIL